MKSERIEAILSEVRGHDLLNLGCVGHKLPETQSESGHWLHEQLCARYPQAAVLGLDIDQANVERMRARGMDAAVGDAQSLNYHARFDTIILGELIEHLENPGSCLEGCRRALKPAGRMIISTPNIFCAMQMLMYLKNFDHAFNTEHVLWFCPQTLRSLVERCGLRVESLRFVDDLAPDVVSRPPYRLFSYMWFAIRWLFPRRYRNTMVAVCAASKQQELAESAVVEHLSSAPADFHRSVPRSRIQAV